MGTISFITSLVVLTRESAAMSMSALHLKHVAGHQASRCEQSMSLRDVKSTCLMLWVGKWVAHRIDRSSIMMIGRWSAFGGCILGLVSQEMMRFRGLFDLQMLSGVVQLPTTYL